MAGYDRDLQKKTNHTKGGVKQSIPISKFYIFGKLGKLGEQRHVDDVG